MPILVKHGTVIYQEQNEECEYCHIPDPSMSQSFPKCLNPLLSAEFSERGEWVLKCPVDCEYAQKMAFVDIDMVKQFIRDNECNGWIGVDCDTWDNLIGNLFTPTDNRLLLLKWIFKVQGYVVYKDMDNNVGSDYAYIFQKTEFWI